MAQRRVFQAYLGQFRGLFKEFGTKTGGRAPPAPPPPSGSAPVLNLTILVSRLLFIFEDPYRHYWPSSWTTGVKSLRRKMVAVMLLLFLLSVPAAVAQWWNHSLQRWRNRTESPRVKGNALIPKNGCLSSPGLPTTASYMFCKPYRRQRKFGPWGTTGPYDDMNIKISD